MYLVIICFHVLGIPNKPEHWLISAEGLVTSHSQDDRIPNSVYLLETKDHFEQLVNLSHDFSIGHWLTREFDGLTEIPNLRLDSRLYVFSENDSEITIEERYAIKGQPRRNDFGTWTMESGLTVYVGEYLQRRSNLSGIE